MRYVRQSTNEIVWLADIRAENPNMSIPNDADCSALGYEKLVLTPPPAEVGFHPVEVAPINNVQQWELVANVVTIEIPSQITPRQCRLALHRAGLLDDAEALVTNDRELSIWWEYSLDIQRDNPMVRLLALQLGIDDAGLDNLFIEASKL